MSKSVTAITNILAARFSRSEVSSFSFQLFKCSSCKERAALLSIVSFSRSLFPAFDLLCFFFYLLIYALLFAVDKIIWFGNCFIAELSNEIHIRQSISCYSVFYYDKWWLCLVNAFHRENRSQCLMFTSTQTRRNERKKNRDERAKKIFRLIDLISI